MGRDYDEYRELFGDYRTGLTVFSSIFVAAIFGCFSLLTLIKSSNIGSYSWWSLSFAYFFFAFIGSYSLGGLVGSFGLQVAAMQEISDITEKEEGEEALTIMERDATLIRLADPLAFRSRIGYRTKIKYTRSYPIIGLVLMFVFLIWVWFAVIS